MSKRETVLETPQPEPIKGKGRKTKKATSPQKECVEKKKKHAFREAFCKILPIAPTGKDDIIAKNQLAYMERKRKRRLKKMIAFGIFCAVILAIMLFSLLASHVFDRGIWISRFFVGIGYVLTHGLNVTHFYVATAEYGVYAIQTITFHRTFVLLTLGYIAITITHMLIKLLAIKADKRRKTIVMLLASLFKFVAYVVIIILLFGILDVDPAIGASIIAAVGIAIGFGAQGVISDLLTGVFLIFENSLEVGDIITVDSFRGEVEEVGMRTTKFTSVTGDVMVINNSQLKKFVNMSMHRSLAISEFIIEYGEDIERVEYIIGEIIPQLAEEYADVITEGPFYKGVQNFNESGVTIRLVSKCDETERMQLERDLNREIKFVFDKNGIKLAIPKVGLMQHVDKPKTQTASTKSKGSYIKKTPTRATKKGPTDD